MDASQYGDGSLMRDELGHGWGMRNHQKSPNIANNASLLLSPAIKNGAPGRYLSIFKFTASRN
ncbi:TPA: hypothetical protein OUE41_003722 [Klebsiella pneumoniae]|uniref:hypothetical protein n=1 Tax=Klebsiella pneumoniae TaxID=573 RepID=UPI0015866C8C|nr:hypothetical protein [Klebsiella pneumoniae]MDH1770582.1 hypothetical protein [Klebsiella pneumoniae]MDO0723939.1 hypothetical protein [Klebsiella pneumoniae]HBQ8829586.1 hypothetical protein [Klebsiella pneumoniae]HBR6634663.1 hypothetical protein [Klebsiella pneumoniae]HBS7261981.1 hypothetical protein [Klebsiella pneumoniae]